LWWPRRLFAIGAARRLGLGTLLLETLDPRRQLRNSLRQGLRLLSVFRDLCEVALQRLDTLLDRASIGLQCLKRCRVFGDLFRLVLELVLDASKSTLGRGVTVFEAGPPC
jgi:hypothetical protein